MFKGKKGQVIFIGIMVGIMVFIAMVQFIKPMKDQITDARAVTSLDCDNSSISVGTKATCVIVDFSLFYFVGVLIAAAIGGMGGFALRRRREAE